MFADLGPPTRYPTVVAPPWWRQAALAALVAAGCGWCGAASAESPAAGDPAPQGVRYARELLAEAFEPAPLVDTEFDFAPQPWAGSSGHLLSLLLLHTYRSTFARTDLDLCAFRPTCSRFAQLAIDEFGMIRGILLAADRLLRDGPGAADSAYQSAGDGRHFLDPITDYQDEPCTNCAGH